MGTVGSLSGHGMAQSAIRAASAGVVSLCLHAAAKALSLFGNQSYETYKTTERLRLIAKQIYINHCLGNLFNFSSPPLPRLTVAKNLARPEVITSREDAKYANSLRDRLVAMTKESNQLLSALYFQGGVDEGLCYAASLYFLKKVLKAKITSEEQLVMIAKTFEKGFPAKAAGLQELYCAYRGLIKNKTDFEVDAIFTALMNLQAKPPIKSAQCYTKAPLGAFLVTIKCPQDAHANVFLKYAFGTYLFDPNFGLMRCTCQADLDTVVKSYDGHILSVQPCTG